MKKHLIIFIAVIVWMACSGLGYATNVAGPVSGVWTPLGNPYNVIGNINVPTGLTLIINPGVEVIFNGNFQFNVGTNATLQALGQKGDSVVFTSAVPGVVIWNGIRFINASSACSLMYCVIEYGSATPGGGGQSSDGGGIFCSGTDLFISHCTIRFCSASGDGGGMYCLFSDPTIEYSTFFENSATMGGGIHLDGCNPTIMECLICDCSASSNGGGLCCRNASNPMIDLTTFTDNSATNGGGIHSDQSSSPMIQTCQISYCVASWQGGGVCCMDNSMPMIYDTKIVSGNLATRGGGIYIEESSGDIQHNIISENAASDGGGIFIGYYSNPSIANNTISRNSAIDGGGLYCDEFTPILEFNAVYRNYALNCGGGSYFWGCDTINTLKNTYYGNVAGVLGGGIYLFSSTIIVNNSIFWDNVDPTGMVPFMQIRLGNAAATAIVSYTDIQGVWPGIGNIAVWPLFVNTAWDDFRLQWGSPCIDVGDPLPIHNDPDGTIADMGCYFFDQSNPVRVLLTPHTTSHTISIPSGGGSFSYTIRATNITPTPQTANIWIDVTKPNGAIYGPVLGPFLPNIPAGVILMYVGTQNVPNMAPEGTYRYNAYAVVAPNTSMDQFSFVKTATYVAGDEMGEWTNWIDSFKNSDTALENHLNPASSSLTSCYPNPFNASTTICFALPEAGKMHLAIYDVSGRLVTELINGWRDAGQHEVTFDGSGLASGVYVYRLQAGEFTASGKMVLMK